MAQELVLGPTRAHARTSTWASPLGEVEETHGTSNWIDRARTPTPADPDGSAPPSGEVRDNTPPPGLLVDPATHVLGVNLSTLGRPELVGALAILGVLVLVVMVTYVVIWPAIRFVGHIGQAAGAIVYAVTRQLLTAVVHQIV